MESLLRLVPEVLFWCYLISLIVSEVVGFISKARRTSHSNTDVISTDGKMKKKLSYVDIYTCANLLLSTDGTGEKLITTRIENADEEAANVEWRPSVDCRSNRSRENLREAANFERRAAVDCRREMNLVNLHEATDVVRRSSVDCRRDRNRDNLREIRRHHRSMKEKYHQNSDNLLYYCFYKGLTEKYYETLRQH